MGKRVGRLDLRRAKVRRRLLVERLGDRRVLASITGAVFEDANHSFQLDPGEANAPSRLIYVDTNNNATLDTGEAFVVAEPDGTFEFPNLADGTYLLRMFNGTQTQTQTFPVEATLSGDTVTVTGSNQLELVDGATLTLTTDSVVVADTEAGTSQTVSVGNELSRMQTLPDGKILVVGTEAGGDTSWIVDPASGTVTLVDLSGLGESTPWSDVAIDGNGRGVLLEHAGSGIVRAIDASDSSSGLQVTTTSNLVPTDTQVVSSDTGNRTVFAWSGTDGLQLSLWSNVTSSFITSPIDVSGTTGLLAFDDASGLLALRTSDGGVSVHDVDADFATLHSLNSGGPIAIDGPRDLLLTISPIDAMLKLINLQDGSLVAELAIDLSTVGQIASLALNDSSDAVVVVGAAGIVEVALRKAAAHEVTIADAQDADPVLFGVALEGNNSSPTYSTPPTFETNEDVSLTLAAPAALNDSSDAESDDYVLVQRSQPEHGTATFHIDGSVSYIPDPDFNGTDSLVVLLHDGRDTSENITVNFNVTSVPDTPSGIRVNIDPVPEDIEAGNAIGDIEVIDADGPGGNYTIEIDDERLSVQNGQIIFVFGPIDHESEPEISAGISVTDEETGETIETVIAVTISDVNEPIIDIYPPEASLLENSPGEFVTQFEVVDQDNDTHTVTVDDDRFEVLVNSDLHLKTGIAVDFEKEPVIFLNVTAKEDSGGGTFTRTLRINVLDVPEQPESIELSNESVMELMQGAVVGEVSLDGGAPSQRYELTVDDSRFEISGNTLKLLDNQFVERTSQSEIELTITAKDLDGSFETISQTFVIEVLENETPYHNQDNPYDVNHTGDITAGDALAIINYLNTFGPGPVGQGDQGFCYDVNADGLVTALDALLVLNELNRISNGGGGTVGGEGETGGEGEQVANDDDTRAPEIAVDDSRARETQGQISKGQLAPELDVRSSARSSATLRDASEGDAYQVAGRQIETPTRSSAQEYADNVDETLRLLSDRSS